MCLIPGCLSGSKWSTNWCYKAQRQQYTTYIYEIVLSHEDQENRWQPSESKQISNCYKIQQTRKLIAQIEELLLAKPL